MTPEERDLFMVRFLAAFPDGRKIPDETILVWHEHLGPMDRDAAFGALRYLERNAKRRPALADIIEAYDAQPRQHGAHEVGAPECGICDDGRIIVRCEGCNCGPRFTDDGRCPAKSTQNLARCPNGCKPMSQEQRDTRDRRVEDQWKRDDVKRREQELDLRMSESRLAEVPDRTASRHETEAF